MKPFLNNSIAILIYDIARLSDKVELIEADNE